MVKAEPNLQAARYAAARLVASYGITGPEAISVEDIAWDRGVHIREGTIEGAEAWLLRKGDKGIVRLSDRIREPGRRRFAIGHELGHWERHLGQSQAWLCSSDDIHAYRGSAAELEANAFSSELLMPRAMIRDYLKEGVSMGLVRHVSDRFRTTLTATAVRIIEESREDCYVVFSRRNQVSWWQRSPKGSGRWFQRGQVLSPESLAWCCDTEPSDSGGMERIPSRAWFPRLTDADGVEVWEESAVLQEYSTVITLLTLV